MLGIIIIFFYCNLYMTSSREITDTIIHTRLSAQVKIIRV